MRDSLRGTDLSFLGVYATTVYVLFGVCSRGVFSRVAGRL